MPVDGALDREAMAKGMPLGHPLYPLPPTIYRDVTAFSVTYQTDPASARSLVPTRLRVPDEPLVTMSFLQIPRSVLGAYFEVQITIGVEFDDGPRAYHAVMYVSEGQPMALGRELLGAPKKEADIGWTESPLGIVGSVQRPTGFPLFSVAVNLDRPLELPPPGAPANKPSLMVRVLPQPEGADPQSEVLLLETPASFELLESWSAHGAVSINGISTIDPLYKLPVREIVAAGFRRMHVSGDLPRLVEVL